MALELLSWKPRVIFATLVKNTAVQLVIIAAPKSLLSLADPQCDWSDRPMPWTVRGYRRRHGSHTQAHVLYDGWPLKRNTQDGHGQRESSAGQWGAPEATVSSRRRQGQKDRNDPGPRRQVSLRARGPVLARHVSIFSARYVQRRHVT